MAKKIQVFSIPFPDFKMGDIIEPEQFDENNATIVNKLNETIGVVNDEKTDLDGDHKGTWQGLTPEQASAGLESARITAVENKLSIAESKIYVLERDSDVAEAKIENLTKVTSNLNLIAEAGNRVKSSKLFGTNFTTPFNMSIDTTKTHTTNNILAGSTIVSVDDATGFLKDTKAYIFADDLYEEVTITAVEGNTLSISPVTRAYGLRSVFAKSMLHKDGTFGRKSPVLFDFESGQDGFTSPNGSSLAVYPTWKTRGAQSLRVRSVDDKDPIARFTHDFTAVREMSFDYISTNREVDVSISGVSGRLYQGKYDATLTHGSAVVDMTAITGSKAIEFNFKFTLSGNTYVHAMDNVQLFSPVKTAEYDIVIPASKDIVFWIDAEDGITSDLVGIDAEKYKRIVSGDETQFVITPDEEITSIKVRSTTSNANVKIRKIFGGFA